MALIGTAVVSVTTFCDKDHNRDYAHGTRRAQLTNSAAERVCGSNLRSEPFFSIKRPVVNMTSGDVRPLKTSIQAE